MSIYRPPPPDEVPEITLLRWRVYRVPAKDGGHTDHFVGYNRSWMEGRVSSEVKTFNTETKVGATRSGRLYALSGEPGMDSDAEYVWHAWKYVNEITDDQVEDVTAEYAGGPGGAE